MHSEAQGTVIDDNAPSARSTLMTLYHPLWHQAYRCTG